MNVRFCEPRDVRNARIVTVEAAAFPWSDATGPVATEHRPGPVSVAVGAERILIAYEPASDTLLIARTGSPEQRAAENIAHAIREIRRAADAAAVVSKRGAKARRRQRREAAARLRDIASDVHRAAAIDFGARP